MLLKNLGAVLCWDTQADAVWSRMDNCNFVTLVSQWDGELYLSIYMMIVWYYYNSYMDDKIIHVKLKRCGDSLLILVSPYCDQKTFYSKLKTLVKNLKILEDYRGLRGRRGSQNFSILKNVQLCIEGFYFNVPVQCTLHSCSQYLLPFLLGECWCSYTR